MVAHKLTDAGGDPIKPPNDGFGTARTFTPQGKLVAVRLFHMSRTKMGLVMPGKAGWQPENLRDDDGNVITLQGEVVANGPACIEVKEGDVVLLQENAISMITRTKDVNGKTTQLVVCNEEHLIGIMNPGEFTRSGE